MRCEECLAVIEEYFDGELERRQSERVGAHLAACEGCSEALDALASEQEMYLRYDRGLEVGPALWEGVRAGVARLAEPEQPAAPARTRAGLGGRLAAFVAALAPRAAFAPALALVLLAAFVGALWLTQRPDREVVSVPPTAGEAADPLPNTTPDPGAPPAAAPEDRGASVGSQLAALVEPPPAVSEAVTSGGTNGRDPRRSARGSELTVVTPPDADHLLAAEDELLAAAQPTPAEAGDVVLATASAPLLTPEEKEMARHLEQAQRLLRSFQNEVAAGGDAVQIAYERRLSRKLLAENESLRLGAEATGDRQTRRVLDTLEPFLLDIANLRDDASRDEVRSIKERMEKKEIIAALHVY